MNTLFEIQPLLVPVLLADTALAAAAAGHVLRHPRCRFGNRAMWLVTVVVLLFFGPIIYFVFGKGESE